MRYLAQGWDRLVRYPLLLMVPLVLQILMSALGLGAMSAMLGWAAAGQVGTGGGFVLLGGLAVLFAGPAVASGYNALVGNAAAQQEVTVGVFTANLGRYYGRILGGALLAGLVFGVLGMIIGLQAYWLLAILSIPLTALTPVWLASVVIDDAGIMAAVGRAGRDIVSRIADYGPLLAILVVAGWVIPGLFGGGQAADFTRPPTFLSNLGSLLSSLIMTTITMFVRAGVFVAYYEGAVSGPGYAGHGPDAGPGVGPGDNDRPPGGGNVLN